MIPRSKVAVLAVTVCIATMGLGLVLFEEDPTAPTLKISPGTLNMDSRGNYMLFAVEGLGDTPETFLTVGIDFGWDLLGTSAPMASFENVTLCPNASSPEDVPICMLEKAYPDEATKFKVSRQLVRGLIYEACDKGGCHPLNQGERKTVNVTMWGEADPGQFFEVNDQLEVKGACLPCLVTVTLESITYVSGDLGNDWRVESWVRPIHPDGGYHKSYIPSKKGTIAIEPGETETIDRIIFTGIIGNKGEWISFSVTHIVNEVDALIDSNDYGTASAAFYGTCPFETTQTMDITVREDGDPDGETATIQITIKVVADP